LHGVTGHGPCTGFHGGHAGYSSDKYSFQLNYYPNHSISVNTVCGVKSKLSHYKTNTAVNQSKVSIKMEYMYGFGSISEEFEHNFECLKSNLT
jgi:hypothetical protein